MAHLAANTDSNMAEAAKTQTLPPLNTVTPRRTSLNRPSSYAQRRISSYSTQSQSQTRQPSRPISQVLPTFHSSLQYTFVRDFAYPASYPLHYGPQDTGVTTPASERSRRLSDPEPSQWSSTPSWLSETSYSNLPAMTFNDGGPPYSEDEDLRSPIVTSSKSRHKKTYSLERGRSPGPTGSHSLSESDREHYHPTNDDSDLDGPGGEIIEEPVRNTPRHRDSNFAKPIQRLRSPYSYKEQLGDHEEETRFSKDYSFTIASPDEEMHGRALALFDFVPEHENELALSEGQVVLVSYRHGQGWLVAEDPASGESGLVPEEFVRLVRHIEGGLNGLEGVEIEETDVMSPVVMEEELAGHTPRPSNGSTTWDKHPAVQSTFSTSSRDFSPLKRDNGGLGTSPEKE